MFLRRRVVLCSSAARVVCASRVVVLPPCFARVSGSWAAGNVPRDQPRERRLRCSEGLCC